MAIEWPAILAEVLTGAALEQAVKRFEMISRLARGRSQQHLVSQYVDAEAARMHPLLYDFIERDARNSHQELICKPLPGGAVTLPVSLVTRGPVELGKLVVPIMRDDGGDRGEYRKIREAIGGKVWDSECYSARSLRFDTDGTLRIGGGLTTYSSALAHQDSLEWELLIQASRLLGSPRATLGRLGSRLPMRTEALRRYQMGDTPGTGSYSALAISTLLVYNDDGDYRLAIGKRSAETGAHADLFHVIPASMHQPELGSPYEEWDIRHTVLKEYAEELFNKDLLKTAQSYKYFYRAVEPVKDLLAALKSGDCRFLTTGVVINQLNFRPEICALLIVDDAEWWQEQSSKMDINWEYAPKQELLRLADSKEKFWTDLHLDTAEQDFATFFGLSPAMWVPPGLAALWLGVDAARRLLGRPNPWPSTPLP